MPKLICTTDWMISAAPIVAITIARKPSPSSGRTKTRSKVSPITTALSTAIAIESQVFSPSTGPNRISMNEPTIIRWPWA